MPPIHFQVCPPPILDILHAVLLVVELLTTFFSSLVSSQAVGSVSQAYQSFKLALTFNNNHAEAYNNLGVIEWRRGRGEQVCEGEREGL